MIRWCTRFTQRVKTPKLPPVNIPLPKNTRALPYRIDLHRRGPNLSTNFITWLALNCLFAIRVFSAKAVAAAPRMRWSRSVLGGLEFLNFHKFRLGRYLEWMAHGCGENHYWPECMSIRYSGLNSGSIALRMESVGIINFRVWFVFFARAGFH